MSSAEKMVQWAMALAYVRILEWLMTTPEGSAYLRAVLDGQVQIKGEE